MRFFLKNFTFALISLAAALELIRGIHVFEPEVSNYVLLLVALTLLYSFMGSLFGILSLPQKGIGYLILSFLLTYAVLYLLTVLTPVIEFVPQALPKLIILGFMLPSKHLTGFQAGIASALLISVIFGYLDWVVSTKKK